MDICGNLQILCEHIKLSVYSSQDNLNDHTLWTISFVYENSNKQERFFGDYTSINEIESGAVQNDKPGAAQEKLFS